MRVVPINSAQGLEALMNEIFGGGAEPEETPSEKELNTLLDERYKTWAAEHGELKATIMMAFVRAQAMAIHCGNEHKEHNLAQDSEVGYGLKKLVQSAWLQAYGLADEHLWDEGEWSSEQRVALEVLGEAVGPVIRQAIALYSAIRAEVLEMEKAGATAGDPADSHPV